MSDNREEHHSHSTQQANHNTSYNDPITKVTKYLAVCFPPAAQRLAGTIHLTEAHLFIAGEVKCGGNSIIDGWSGIRHCQIEWDQFR